VDNKEVELLKIAINSKNSFINIQSNENYLKMHETTMNYINYINNNENKTPAEKLRCVKNLFDRTNILKEIPIKAEVYLVNKIKQNNLINFTKIWNWIFVRVYIHEFTVFIAFLLTLLANIFFSNNSIL
jgi:hypothetical protein